MPGYDRLRLRFETPSFGYLLVRAVFTREYLRLYIDSLKHNLKT
jgi:hypothetical protein